MNHRTLAEVEERELVPGFKVRFVHSATMTFAYWTITEGAELPLHNHPHEQVAHVFEGDFELTLDGETKILRPGTVTVIPSNVPHGGKALTPCRMMDAFHPVREDYR